MEDSISLDSPARWKAVSHPLRLGILRQLLAGPQTNEELARALGVASGKLHFHTKKLLDAGLIVPAGTRQKGAITEKLYAAAARGFSTPTADPSAEPSLMPLLRAAAQLYQSTWQEFGDPYYHGGHYILYHTEQSERELIGRLLALMDDFQAHAVDPETPGARPLALTQLLHRLTPGALAPEKEDP
jgi:DNA-binding transcriptional ArsR family regulator